MYHSYEENEEYDDYEEALRRAEWKKKLSRMKREKERALRRRRIFIKIGIPAIIIGLLAIVIAVGVNIIGKSRKNNAKETVLKEAEAEKQAADTSELDIETEEAVEEPKALYGDISTSSAYKYTEADNMDFLSGDNMQSANAILVNLATNTIEGQKDYKARIVPASMTKVMTLLVASKHISNPEDKVTISIEATDFSYSNDCSSVGFSVGEVVTVEDLMYGTILSSGGDAAAQLAIYVAGSQEKFVELMNEECANLGIDKTTHFTNTVGVYDTNLYSTCYDMAIIMNEAINSDFCRQVLSAKKYTTSKTAEHPEGITISNWFLRRIEDKDCGGEVTSAKTGYVVQSGNCAVSYGESESGTPYICVTANAHSAWRCIYDHVDIYKNHTK